MSIYDQIMSPAFAGMKADAGLGRVESYSAETVIPFGVAVAVGADGVKLGENAIGVALHSHAVVGEYQKADSVSVMTKGLVWCQASKDGDITDRGTAKYDPATGIFSDAGTAELKNAIFRSGKVNAGKYGYLALVELA